MEVLEKKQDKKQSTNKKKLLKSRASGEKSRNSKHLLLRSSKKRSSVKKVPTLFPSLETVFKNQVAQEKWGFIQKDMSNAMNFWEDITKKYEGKPNNDDKQMLEIKRLLKELQKKLSHFD